MHIDNEWMPEDVFSFEKSQRDVAMEMARQDEIEHLSDDFYPELFGSKKHI